MEYLYQIQKEAWAANYSQTDKILERMQEVDCVLSCFNSNIDAVIKITPEMFKKWLEKVEIENDDYSFLLSSEDPILREPKDLMRAFYNSFRQGKPDEWLVASSDLNDWIVNLIGLENCKCQMGGQGGIIANLMSIVKVQQVLAHSISLCKDQSKLFLSLENLSGVDQDGQLKQIQSIQRTEDKPLVHFILEYNAQEIIQLPGLPDVQSPRAGRFIATYDPDNFDLKVDPKFIQAVINYQKSINFLTLSGYQLMRSVLTDGSSGFNQIDYSIEVIKSWKEKHPEMWVHFELAETHDRNILLHAINTIGKYADSIGLNEVELQDALEVLHQETLLNQCTDFPNAISRFLGCKYLLQYLGVKRIQIHFFGMFMTLTTKDFTHSLEQIKDGMMLAAVVAASKCGTGTIDVAENLLWGKEQKVNDHALRQLDMLSDFIGKKNTLKTTGIFEDKYYNIVAVPTIIVDKPLTLVGMGDTISSVSLVGSGKVEIQKKQPKFSM